MDIRMNERTKQWLRLQGGVTTIDPFVFPGLIKNKRILVDHEISHEEPEELEDYYRCDVDDLVIYVNCKLRTKACIELSIGGRAPFEQLQVKGVKRLFTENAW
ncbi:hypothetical protein [Alkalicoccus daliensis]|uniref:Uncharacterized protein n=1 Tax=Alkalicoccus daliensis TaxID=745820 RepID=A0A1G9ZK30_9BACI|nr:hypothetical protein [Alkalicoccus daliensis]SDN21465.1 hypothetical protein SAMN04488053_101132 [Alkalicoccus daliensis]